MENIELPVVKKTVVLDEPEDVTTVMHGKVRVTKYGAVHIINEENQHMFTNKGHLKESAKKKLRKQKEERLALKVKKDENPENSDPSYNSGEDETELSAPPAKKRKPSVKAESDDSSHHVIKRKVRKGKDEKASDPTSSIKERKEAKLRKKKEVFETDIEKTKDTGVKVRKVVKKNITKVKKPKGAKQTVKKSFSAELKFPDKATKKNMKNRKAEKASNQKSTIGKKVTKTKKMKKV